LNKFLFFPTHSARFARLGGGYREWQLRID
jgi:hypothetical protein